jgi:hypothetical protein
MGKKLGFNIYVFSYILIIGKQDILVMNWMTSTASLAWII